MTFIDLCDVPPKELVAMLNECEVRAHLIKHELFTVQTAYEWVSRKAEMNAIKGCYIQAIDVDGQLAGWCGIQPDGDDYEVAVVLRQRYWGIGISVFRVLLDKAKSMGHKEVVLNLLSTRPKYESLVRRASKVEIRQIHGGCFTSYFIPL
ncbi:GNAT family N-acetyltransferase [Photobacterium ganghwense]|uniref:GNAT family N-acetyltransferase n=1 Tax=Photobacterium ganghwense TaxID=320778 RepID=UPI001A8CB42E|nr:hypothetical protein [Photobacterium ganghwense]QSV16142.1 hypothetical protein FH974_23195 [Photobacterium ganghwense]